MIWLSQLQSHNGINFFAEILGRTPQLISAPPRCFGTSRKDQHLKENAKKSTETRSNRQDHGDCDRIQRELYCSKA